MNKIQYIGVTHTSKDEAKDNKRHSNELHNIYYKECSFDDICEILECGSTFGRIGKTTDFVAIDIDNTTVNIMQVYEKFKDNADYHISYSSSNNPLKYHILVNLHKTITIDEYKRAVETEFEKIKNTVCGRCDIFQLDEHADNFYQCFFGQSVENRTEFVLDNSKRLFNWTKKDTEPKFFIGKEVKQHPSLNSADYCKKHGLLTIKENKRFDLYLPSMTGGKLKKISQGHRYNWTKMTGAKVLMRILYLNHDFNEGWTKWDFLDTLEWVVRTNVFNPDEFCNSEDYKGLVRFFDNKWDILMDKPFEMICETLEPYFDCSKRQYKSRLYNPTVMSTIISEHRFDETTVAFTDREELQTICNNLSINYYKFTAYCKSIGYKVEFECITKADHKSHSNKGKCLANFEVIENTVSIPKEQITNAIRKYCSKNKIKLIPIK